MKISITIHFGNDSIADSVVDQVIDYDKCLRPYTYAQVMSGRLHKAYDGKFRVTADLDGYVFIDLGVDVHELSCSTAIGEI